MIRFSRSFAVLILGITLLGALAAPTLAAPGSAGENAAKCLGSGYLDYTRENRTPFKNAGQCTRYAAQDGQLVPVRTVTVSFYETEIVEVEEDYCGFFVDVTGFEPGYYVLHLLSTGPGGVGSYVQDIDVQADGTGRYQSLKVGIGGNIELRGATLTATLNGVSSAPVLVAC